MLLMAGQEKDAFSQLPAGNNSNATTEDHLEAPGGQKTLFGCEVVNRAVHCNRISNEFESYLVQGSTEKLYTVTKDNADIGFVEGVDGSSALEFNAYFGEFVNAENNAELNAPEFSVSFWAKRSHDPGFSNYGHVVSHVSPGTRAGWLFDVGNTTSQSIRFGVASSSGTVSYAGDVNVNDSNFTHIVGTFDGSSVKVYANGALQGAVPFSGTYDPDPDVPLKIAMASFNFGFPWEGTIDEVRVYNKTLTEEEVKSLSLSLDSPSNDGALVGHWPFDRDVQDIAGDIPTEYIVQTVGMAFAPDGRLFFTEKNTGKIRVMMAGQNHTVLQEPFATVPDLHYDMEQGLLGIAIDPEFEENRYLYAYYTARSGNDTAPFNRVVRFTDANNTGTGMTVIVDGIPAHRGGMHAGGAIAFDPDGKLYIAVGNAYQPVEAQNSASLLGKVLRINKDGTIPEDNPIPGSPVYSIGHRNSYGIAFDNDGNGIVTENGDDLFDEINLLVRGGNYGYPTLQQPNMPPAATNETGGIKPIRSYWKTIAPTQATFYDGEKFPDLVGKFLVGSYNNGRLYALEVNQTTDTLSEELKIQFPYREQSIIIGVAQSPVTGDIYFGGYYIYRLDSIDQAREPIVAIVSVDSSQEVENLAFDSANRELTISLAPETGVAAPVAVEIPKLLLDEISAVSIDNEQNAEFSIASSESVNVVSINAPAGQPASITIAGNATRLAE